jgi:lipoate-protein ligase A
VSWKKVTTGEETASFLMEKDARLLESLGEDPILHLYRWKGKCATYGHFIKVEEFLDRKVAQTIGLDLAKRPTGGGIIFHLWDLAFSVLVPSSHPAFSQNTLDNYAFVNRAVLAAIQELLQEKHPLELTPVDGVNLGSGCGSFCMAKPTRYDVMLGEKKVAGAAQRKTRHGFLHQGSISLLSPSFPLLQEVLHEEYVAVLKAMEAFTYPVLGCGASLKDLEQGRREVEALLEKHLMREMTI